MFLLLYPFKISGNCSFQKETVTLDRSPVSAHFVTLLTNSVASTYLATLFNHDFPNAQLSFWPSLTLRAIRINNISFNFII